VLSSAVETVRVKKTRRNKNPELDSNRTDRPQLTASNLVARIAPAVLPPIIRAGLLAVAAKAVIDPIRPAIDRVDHAIRPDIGAGIKIGWPVIVQVNRASGVHVPMMVMDVHIGISSE